MAILTDHETMAQFTLGLIGISLIFSGYLLFRIREIGLNITCMHEGFHEFFLEHFEEMQQISEEDAEDYILEFADHLGIPKYKKNTSKHEEENNNSSEVSEWDSGANE